MRRVLFAALALIVCLGMAPHAQANVLETPGKYKVKFDGYEYAYWGSSDDFNKGNADLVQTENLVDPTTGKLGTGFNMSAVLATTSILEAIPNSSSEKTIYSRSDTVPGIYISVMRDLQASFSTGSLATKDAIMYFTGGVIDWYFLPNLKESDLYGMNYKDGLGMSGNKGSLMDLLAGVDPFASFKMAETIDLDGKKYTGSASVTYENGALKGNANFSADATPGSIFDSNAFNGHDMEFQATLWWDPVENRFRVEDPAKVNVPTPEPSTLSLMALGLLLTGVCLRKRRTT